MHIIFSIKRLLNLNHAEEVTPKSWSKNSRYYLFFFVPLAIGIIIPGFNLHFRAIVTKAAWHCDRKRNFNQWNKTVESHITTYCCSILISKKKKSKIHSGEKIASSADGAGQTGKLYVEEWNWTPISPCINLNDTGMKDLSMRLHSLSLKEKIWNTLGLISTGKYFLNKTLLV